MKKLTDEEIQKYRAQYSEFFDALIATAADLELRGDVRGIQMLYEAFQALMTHVVSNVTGRKPEEWN